MSCAPGRSTQPGDGNVLARWNALIDGYSALRDALRAHTQLPHLPGIDPHLTMLKAEAATTARLLDQLARSDEADTETDDAVRTKLAASNLSAREFVWRTLRKHRGMLALDRRFDTQPPPVKKTAGGGGSSSQGRRRGQGRFRHEDTVFVNAVVDSGRTWLRIVTTSESKLQLEMAESGWEFGDDNDDDDNEDVDIGDISVAKVAAELVQASRANRYKGACPRICLLLSRIGEGTGSRDTDALLRRLRRRLEVDSDDVKVDLHCANSPFATAEPPSLDEALVQLMPEKDNALTPTLNIDTSILIALASDITHRAVPLEPWHASCRASEIGHERAHPGEVLRTLCCLLDGRSLVCTREAAAAFRTMVGDMGQPSEKARMRCLLPDGEGESEREQRLSEFRRLSDHPDAIAGDLVLPIVPLDEDWDAARIQQAVHQGDLPPAAAAVAGEMETAVPTRSVFFYGWASGHATVTMNLSAKNRIARLLERFRTSPAEKSPAVCLCRNARGLNGTPTDAMLQRRLGQEAPRR